MSFTSAIRKKKPSLSSGKRWTPEPYQRRAVKWLVERRNAILFLDPGLGKTSIAYAAFKVLKKAGFAFKMLVVAPLRPAVSTWPDEAKEWIDFHGLRVVVLHGPHKDKLLAQDADVYVINPEGLEWLLQAVKVRVGKKNKVKVSFDKRRWNAFKFDTLVLDELSGYKHTDTTRYKLMELINLGFERRWGLTGSLSANGIMHVFGQCKIIDGGLALGRFITHFRAAFFNKVSEWDYVLQPGAEKRLHLCLKDLALSMSAEDYITLPQLVVVPVWVDLPPDARDMYDAMEEELFYAMRNGEVLTAGTAGVAYGKCRQIASGAVYKNPIDPETGMPRAGKKEWVWVHDAKLDALQDLREELQGHQLLLAYDFGHDLERIRQRLDKNMPYIGSGVSVKKGKELEALWNAGDIPLLGGHPQSMAHGLNFQKGNANHIAWFSQNADFERYDQFNRRLRRRGNKAARVMCYHVAARATVDVAIMATLRKRNAGQRELMQALADYQRGRRR